MSVQQASSNEGQTSGGVRGLLESATFYESFQRIMGKQQLRQEFVDTYVRPSADLSIVDVGCGPGDLAPHCAPASYTGVDTSERYITAAERRFGAHGRFFCGTVAELDEPGTFDVAVMVGVLHHLDDATATAVIDEIRTALVPGGRFVALEPHFHAGQHPVSKTLIRMDRGNNVRDESGYTALLDGFDVTIDPRDDMFRVPYSLLILEATLAGGPSRTT